MKYKTPMQRIHEIATYLYEEKHMEKYDSFTCAGCGLSHNKCECVDDGGKSLSLAYELRAKCAALTDLANGRLNTINKLAQESTWQASRIKELETELENATRKTLHRPTGSE